MNMDRGRGTGTEQRRSKILWSEFVTRVQKKAKLLHFINYRVEQCCALHFHFFTPRIYMAVLTYSVMRQALICTAGLGAPHSSQGFVFRWGDNTLLRWLLVLARSRSFRYNKLTRYQTARVFTSGASAVKQERYEMRPDGFNAMPFRHPPSVCVDRRRLGDCDSFSDNCCLLTHNVNNGISGGAECFVKRTWVIFNNDYNVRCVLLNLTMQSTSTTYYSRDNNNSNEMQPSTLQENL